MFGSPIDYDTPLFRPPSESESLLVQVTLGCSHNKCTYCGMYRTKKYLERPIEKVVEEIKSARKWFDKMGHYPRKAFLCDGDALNAPTENLLKAVREIKKYFPEIVRVGVYATAQNMLDKSEDELKELCDAGLGIVYLGLESGSDKVLKLIVKGNTRDDMIKGSLKIKEAGFKISMIVMLGVAGRELSKEHCSETAEVVKIVRPDFLSFLTTTVIPDSPYDRMIKKGKISPLTYRELLVEMRDILCGIEGMDGARSIFRANHVSNQFPLSGILPRDIPKLLLTLDGWISKCPEGTYPEMDYRML